MRPQTEKFVKQVVEQTIGKRVCVKPSPKTNGMLRYFGNVMIDEPYDPILARRIGRYISW